MDKPKQISFYDNPEALGLVECLRINMTCFCSSLEFIKQQQAIDESFANTLKSKLQRQIEYVDRLQKLFDKE